MFPNAVVLCNLNLPPNSTATGLGKDPPGKISSSNARHVYRVLLPMRRCESSSSSTSTVLGYGSTGQKDHPPFVGRPFRTTPEMVYHNAVGAGAAVLSPRCRKTDPPTPPAHSPVALTQTGKWSARKPTPYRLA